MLGLETLDRYFDLKLIVSNLSQTEKMFWYAAIC